MDVEIKEFKEILEEKAVKDIFWGDAREGADNLARFVELLYHQTIVDHKQKLKLKLT